MSDNKPMVGVVMGSDSDWPLVQKGCATLESFGVPYETRVISAHRTPEEAIAYSKGAEARGIKVIIACAGGAAHLAGVRAAGTVLPVIGVPLPFLSGGGTAMVSMYAVIGLVLSTYSHRAVTYNVFYDEDEE